MLDSPNRRPNRTNSQVSERHTIHDTSRDRNRNQDTTTTRHAATTDRTGDTPKPSRSELPREVSNALDRAKIPSYRASNRPSIRFLALFVSRK